MKYLFLLLFLSSCATKVATSSDRVDLQIYVDEAISKSLVEEFPILVLSDISVKNLSPEGMKYKYYKRMKRSDLFLIPKNCASANLIWGEVAEKGVIVKKSATFLKPQTNNIRYIYHCKEITTHQRDSLNSENVKDVIFIKVDHIFYDFCFLSSVE